MNPADAAPVRVLVTRPRAESEIAASRMEKLGFSPIIEPLLTIVPVAQQINLDGIQALIFTSANGVRAFPGTRDISALPVFTVGDATAMAARAAGFVTVHAGFSDSDALARAIIDRLDSRDGAVLHLSGRDIRGNLAEILRDAGFDARREIVYAAEPASRFSPGTENALRQGRIDAALFFSPRTGKIFANLLEMAGLSGCCATMTAICLSAAIRDNIAVLDWDRIIAAKSPQLDMMISELETAFPAVQGS